METCDLDYYIMLGFRVRNQVQIALHLIPNLYPKLRRPTQAPSKRFQDHTFPWRHSWDLGGYRVYRGIGSTTTSNPAERISVSGSTGWLKEALLLWWHSAQSRAAQCRDCSVNIHWFTAWERELRISLSHCCKEIGKSRWRLRQVGLWLWFWGQSLRVTC